MGIASVLIPSDRAAGAATSSSASPRYSLLLSTDPSLIEAAQRLRYDVFTSTPGFALPAAAGDRDVDRFDEYCDHLLVRDDDSGEHPAQNRNLDEEQDARADHDPDQTANQEPGQDRRLTEGGEVLRPAVSVWVARVGGPAAQTNREQRQNRRHHIAAGLDPGLARPVGHYSQGMRQRTSLARALVNDPKILLLDEPFSNVDVHSANEMVQLLARIRDEGKTIFIVTHQAALLEKVADEFVWMEHGKIIERTRKLKGELTV